MTKSSTMSIIDGHDLSALLTALRAHGDIARLRIDFREDGVAIKINEGMWSPTVGRRADSGGY